MPFTFCEKGKHLLGEYRIIFHYISLHLECFDQYTSSHEDVFSIKINMLGKISFIHGHSFNTHNQNDRNIYFS